ncbi:antibiotic biosynthesis monooxygenase [Micromonospora sp. WMMD1102]|uniref:putative quinol monooxygenase n=1 Tax=Micromonospora sp. WMMD1102 TaxID=3016105 RepID=UPI00241586AB|nr:antibiotic biosynthesis monooxygenase family protein [Micromonospora sp. WMMD1102]MDG4786719.1 antibiotic biosynthesis monooxygenase [Micromonospora sp. WMMD1102]
MIIIAGHELVAAEERDAFVEAFRGMVTRARDFDGCLHIAITADSVDPERVNVTEVWRDVAALKKWRRQAKGPTVAKPTYADIKRYDASDGGSLF